MLDKELKEYLIINSLKFSEIGDNLIEIDSKKYYYHNVEVPLIDDEGELILDIDNTILKLILTLGDGLEGIIYKFGPFFLYTKLDALCNVDLEEFKYLGEINEEVYFKSFLGVHGVYERMTGIGEYSEWVKKAKFLGYDTLAICERGTLGGVLQFQGDCQKKGIKPIIGYSLPIETPSGNKTDLKLYVKTAKGWSNLLEISKSLTTSELNYVELSSISKSDDLICVFEPGEHLNSEFIDSLKELFSEVFIQISNKVYQSNVKDKEYLLGLKAYIESEDFKKKVKPVLIHDAYCLDSNQTYLRKLLNKQGGVGFQNMTEDHYFKSSKKLIVDFISLFNSKDYQTILKDSIESIKYITDNCNFIVEKGKLFLPKYEMSEEQKKLYSTNNDLFIALLKEGFARKIKDRKAESQERMVTELQVIKQGFIDYFLILWDICNWCRQNGIQVGPGRGSAGGSIVSYLLGITDINPLDFNLLFERFLNESRIKSELPDIDIDFASDRRDEVIDYMRSKYGEEYVCRVGTYNTLQLKGALQELERYYGNNTPGTPISLLTKEINTDERNSGVTTWGGLIREGIQSKRFKKYIENNYEVVRDCKHVLGCIKSISIHPCATIIMPKLVREEDGVKLDLFKQIPVRQDGDTIVSEWEGNLLADIGYLKEDILSTKQMAKFGHILSLIKENTGRDIDVSQIPLDDEDVLELFRKGNNQDVFHFGSPGLTEYLKILKPYSVEDLIAAISLYRPGVMASGTHMKFVKLKNGEEEVEYEHPLLEEVTQNTLGLYIYQEQIMKIAQVLGGFSLVEADGVRKAMGKMDKKKMDEYKVHFVQNAQKNNCSEENALRIWNKMEVFSGYGFNKCISGSERIYRVGLNKSGSSTFNPTIGEMYRIKNDKGYARSVGKLPLHYSYNYKGYGSGFSLNENNLLIKNKIVDIRYEGRRELFRITLEDGKTIDTTDNHKYPTQRGEVILSELSTADFLFINTGYKQEDTTYRFTNKGSQNSRYHSESSQEDFELNSKKGVSGFTEKGETSYKKLQNYIKKDYCEICREVDERLEIHHKDTNHGNNEPENLLTVCCSCHKKEHYKLGRTKMGEKGLQTELVKIRSIESIGFEEVYDVEMDSPYNTFVTQNGVVTCNSHATAYSVIGYQCNWLKYYFPLEFWTIALEFADKDNVPMMVAEINSLGSIKVKAPDINQSERKFYSSKEDRAIYWNFGQIAYMGEASVEALINDRRQNGKYYSFDEFNSRVGKAVKKTGVINCILSGCFDIIEKIKKPSERYRLVKQYLTTRDDFKFSKEHKVELKELKDKVDRGEESIQYYNDFKLSLEESYLPKEYVENKTNDYYWILKQSEICKLSLIDYETLVKDKLGKSKVLLEETFNKEVTKRGESYFLPGLILETNLKKTKTGKDYLVGKIQQGSSILQFRMWEEAIKANNIELLKEGALVILDGKLTFNDFFMCNEFLVQKFTTVL